MAGGLSAKLLIIRVINILAEEKTNNFVVPALSWRGGGREEGFKHPTWPQMAKGDIEFLGRITLPDNQRHLIEIIFSRK